MKILKWIKRIFLWLISLILFLLIIGFAYEQISRLMVRDDFRPEGGIVDVGSHNLHYLLRGKDGPTVVFESGLDPAGHLNWFKVQRELAEFTTTISYDRAGILWSERGEEEKNSDSVTKDLRQMLAALQVPKPYILVGHSLGGMTIRDFVDKHAEDVAAVILVEAMHPELTDRMPDELKRFIQSPPTGLFKFISQVGGMRLFYRNMYDNTEPTDRINQLMPALIHRSVNGFLDEGESSDVFSEEAKGITYLGNIPVIVITGGSPDKFDQFPDEEMRKNYVDLWNELQQDLLNLSSNSRQVIAPNSGHNVPLDEPEVIVNAIREVLQQVK